MSSSIRKARRRAALATLGFSLLFFGAAPSVAAADSSAATIPSGGGANNVVLAPTLADGSSLVRSNVQVSQAGGNTIQSANIASALATGCTACHSTAVAVQVVLVTGDPQYFLPQNAATAVNSSCESCGTFAYAWQYAPRIDRPVVLTPDARQQIATIKAQIDATSASIVPDTLVDDELLQSQLDALTTELKSVVDSQVAAAAAHATGAPVEHVDHGPNS